MTASLLYPSVYIAFLVSYLTTSDCLSLVFKTFIEMKHIPNEFIKLLRTVYGGRLHRFVVESLQLSTQ